MKALLTILALICLSFPLKAQNDRQSQQFVRSVIDEKELIIYEDGISGFRCEEMQHFFNKPKTLQSLSLTKDEVAAINKQLKELQNYKWKDGLFAKGRLVKASVINKIFEDTGKGWPYFYARYGTRFYDIAKPIFIRNNTVCIFYCGYSCGGLCGKGEMSLYVFQSGKWVKKTLIYSWIS